MGTRPLAALPLFFCFLSMFSVRAQFVSPDGIMYFSDLKLQNEKLSAVIDDLRSDIRSVVGAVEGLTAEVNSLKRIMVSSCTVLHKMNPSLPSGVYDIYPISAHQQVPVKQSTYCDMETLEGGWTLVQRTVWNFTESARLLTDYSSFFNIPINDGVFEKAYRLPAKYWTGLQASVARPDNMFKFYIRDEPSAQCTGAAIGEDGAVMIQPPLIHVSNGTRWSLPEVQDEGTGIVEKGSQVYGAGPEFLFNSAAYTPCFVSPGNACTHSACSENVVPFQYNRCCWNCPVYSDGVFQDNLGHPLVNDQIPTTADLNGNTLRSLAPHGGCSWVHSDTHFGFAAIEYFVR
eukprot:GCRY01002003.1.p1 GENE.GCRY01002003.1~~GCRY01002003.1.p1  ORF type:complete len:345 (-),score=35.90 GCRY01002003.1:90-1124(-)